MSVSRYDLGELSFTRARADLHTAVDSIYNALAVVNARCTELENKTGTHPSWMGPFDVSYHNTGIADPWHGAHWMQFSAPWPQGTNSTWFQAVPDERH
jgi:hypothetical protein